MFHPPFAYCLWSVVCRAGFGKPDLPSVWPAPGRIRFSGFCLVRVSGSRRWLHLRFPALLVSPVSNLTCSSGFRCWLLLRFSSCPSLPVFSLTCSCGSRICPALRLDALLRQLSISSPSALRHTAGGAAAQSRKPSFTNCSRMRVQSATGRFTPSTNRIGQPRLLSSM